MKRKYKFCIEYDEEIEAENYEEARNEFEKHLNIYDMDIRGCLIK